MKLVALNFKHNFQRSGRLRCPSERYGTFYTRNSELVTLFTESGTYKPAIESSNYDKWREAMQTEAD